MYYTHYKECKKTTNFLYLYFTSATKNWKVFLISSSEKLRKLEKKWNSNWIILIMWLLYFTFISIRSFSHNLFLTHLILEFYYFVYRPFCQLTSIHFCICTSFKVTCFRMINCEMTLWNIRYQIVHYFQEMYLYRYFKWTLKY